MKNSLNTKQWVWIVFCLMLAQPVCADNVAFAVPANADNAPAVESAEAAMIKEVMKSVVDIRTSGQRFRAALRPHGFFEQWGRDFFEASENKAVPINFTSEGAGVIIDESGLVLTNAHVVSVWDRIEVRMVDGQMYASTLIREDETVDLALLKMEAYSVFPAMRFANSEKVNVTDKVYAIGNPFSYSHTVTQGTITGLDRTVPVNNFRAFHNMLQTDTPVDPGNSGGPLIDETGRMIGIMTLKDARSKNMGFAISTKKITDVLPRLRVRLEESLEYESFIAQFGMTLLMVNSEDEESYVFIDDILADSEAYRMGVREGDVLLQFRNVRPRGGEDVVKEASAVRSGDIVYIQIKRDGKTFFTYIPAK